MKLFIILFRDKTSKILSIFLILSILIIPLSGFYLLVIKDYEYIQIKTPIEFDLSKKGHESIKEGGFYKLTNFCIDEELIDFVKTENNRDQQIATYFFLNNTCDSSKSNNYLVIVEMENKYFSDFKNEMNEDVIANYYFSGRLYTNLEKSKAGYFRLKNKIKKEKVYFFTSCITPKIQHKENLLDFYFSVFISTIFIFVFVVSIYYYEKSYQKNLATKANQIKYSSQSRPPGY